MFPVGVSQVLGLECLNPFSCLYQECSNLNSIEEDRYYQHFVEHELSMKADFALLYLFPSNVAVAIGVRISAL